MRSYHPNHAQSDNTSQSALDTLPLHAHNERMDTERYKRHRPQPRGMSGKFTAVAHYSPRQYLYMTTTTASGCIIPNAAVRAKKVLDGYIRKGVWYIPYGPAQPTPSRGYQRRYVRAILPIYEHTHGITLRHAHDAKPTEPYDTLVRTCKNRACLNSLHYRKETRYMLTDEYTLMMYKAANARHPEEFHLTFDTHEEATNFRFSIYNVIKRIRRKRPDIYERDISIFKLRVDGNTLYFTREDTPSAKIEELMARSGIGPQELADLRKATKHDMSGPPATAAHPALPDAAAAFEMPEEQSNAINEAVREGTANILEGLGVPRTAPDDENKA